MAFAVVGCAPNAGQDSLRPAGPYAEKPFALFSLVFWVAVAVFVLVEGGIVAILYRYRHRRGREGIPPQVHGNPRLEVAWTILPALVLVIIGVPTVTTIYDLARAPRDPGLEVTVVGHQWWWEFDYGDLGFRTAGELHIPTGTPVLVHLQAEPAQQGGVGAAVIHSFWVPQLAGKQDAVPGRTNQLVLQADEPGTYFGQCAEFCGLSHANMRFRVVAEPPAEFDAWVAAQQAEAAAPADPLARQGMDLFLNPLSGGRGACIACHAIRGTPAAAVGGPDLTHFASRDCFAGCTLEVNEDNLRRWLADPGAVKAGALMPDYQLSPEEIDALVAYLMSLS